MMRKWGDPRPFMQPRAHGSAWRAKIAQLSSTASISGRGGSAKSTIPLAARMPPKRSDGSTSSFVAALHPSRVLQKPFVPPSVLQDAGHNSNIGNRHQYSSVDSTAIHALTILPIDELVQGVHRFSRTNFSPAQRPLLCAYLKEIMKPHRMAQMPIKAIQDYLHLSHVAGLHDTCLEVYHAARAHMSPAALSLHPKAIPLSSGEPPSNGGTPSLGGSMASATAAITGSSSNGSGSSSNLVAGSAVLVSNFVVDSAYAVYSSLELTRMASYCASQLLAANVSASSAPQNANGENAAAAASPQQAVLAVRSPQETVMEFSLVRCLWRALCLAEHYRCTEASGVNEAKGKAERALADAMTILEACQRVGAARREALARLQDDALHPASSAPQNSACDGSASSPHMLPQQQPGQLTDFLQKGVRFVRYASTGDDGEFSFFHFCWESGILTSPKPFPRSVRGQGVSSTEGSGDASSSPPSSSSLSTMYDADEVQVFYGSLIETCSTGQLVPEAMLYFTEARRLLGCDPLADEDDNSATVLMASAEAREGVNGVVGEGVPVSSTAPPSPLSWPLVMGCGAPAPPSLPPPALSTGAAYSRSATPTAAAAAAPKTQSSDLFTDFLIHRLLFTLQAARDNRRIVRVARALIAVGAATNIKVNLWTLLLISAGALRAADVVLVAHNFAMQQLTNAGGDGAEASSGSERRTWEYLLQTALSALSKCQLPHYEQDYLLPAQEGGVLHCTDEFYYGCLLQDAHNSMNPVQRAAEVLARMGDAKVPLTAPLISRLLKLYLRVEAAEFLLVYKHAAEELHLRRVLWTDQLVLWADRRRYFLTADDRAYIVEEMLRSRNVKDVSRLLPMLGGLRSQFALLHYDLTHAARERFLQDGTLPEDAPTMQDSRAHFLTTRALNVQRGMTAPSGHSWVCENDGDVSGALGDCDDGAEEEWVETEHYGVQPRMLGDSPRRRLHAAIAELSQTPLLLPTASGGGFGKTGVTRRDVESLRDEALRVYLADVLSGLQRSLNSVS
ncbi:hypothetical protein ABL78_5366 [Leptomonas seymouri]|uniref:Uncharacterized protein n=1 Tax=Leptomonas seymouri TaxID=5684 RepID=A0A0N1PCK2_LEPSE|nr:hypothetical protein ABL78_5366 [Leptomonas seymouri]|eukprot:KPI85591.1 hypothetical protein ABL78_5366 [Leptomonas seymouri]